MKIMTYNIQNDYRLFNNGEVKNKIKDITSLIKRYDIDIIGMQELSPHQLGFYKKNLEDYIFVGEHRHSGFMSNEYTGLFVKKNIKVLGSKTYSLSKNPERLGTKMNNHKFPRITTLIHIKYDNKKYLVVNTHLDNSDDINRSSELDILKNVIKKEIKQEYLIIMGDFNMDENKYLKSFAKDLDIKNCTVHLGNTYTLNKNIIDHIYISKDLKCDYKEKLLVDFSDHYPLTISVSSK